MAKKIDRIQQSLDNSIVWDLTTNKFTAEFKNALYQAIEKRPCFSVLREEDNFILLIDRQKEIGSIRFETNGKGIGDSVDFSTNNPLGQIKAIEIFIRDYLNPEAESE